ncbi:MAG TPA: hypothetical protein VGX25_35355 [Actinophytocola sp.]|uniref:hypothetical protein n=1 Tax=Actinophytocola sp. TaxID=1872138 RepID=UPI002DDD08DB|nr:hypothetical protein [Actinophytocola sp.]HEV2784692.1 hypothetical protein [Actinophytocola sp.]
MPPRKKTTLVVDPDVLAGEADEQAALARQEPLPEPIAYPRTYAEAVEAERAKQQQTTDE